MSVVLLYLVIVLLVGYFLGRKYRKDSAIDFMTGGKSLNWAKTGLTLIAMSIDTGIMGVAGLGFVWGLTIQWNAANLWVTAPLAAMFIIPIYWRTKIVTTPELLEKRFNVASRAFFSVVMSFYSIIVLGTSIYLGSLILTELFNWPIYAGCAAIMVAVGMYVVLGGMKTVLTINIYQSVFILATLFTVAAMVVYQVGGISAFAAIKELDEVGQVLPSTLLPFDPSLFSKAWYPMPQGIVWASMAGVSWLACNYAMVQRLLAAKNEQHAQKAILFTGAGHVFTFILGYTIGVGMRILEPDVLPDKSYIIAIFNYFPVGVSGLLIAGLLASLLSSIDGLITSASTMITKDIYLRFVRPQASDRNTKSFARIVQVLTIVLALMLIPMAAQSKFIIDFIQSLVADLFGVVIAIYLIGIFSRRATPNAAFIAMMLGLLAAVVLDFGTEVSFPYVGIISFSVTVAAAMGLSYFEKPLSQERLKNLTVFTLEDVKGPWVGLRAWPDLWKAIIMIVVVWFTLTTLWELYVRVAGA